MKTTLLYIAALVVIATATLTSCEQDSTKGRTKVDYMKYQYAFYCAPELMNAADVEITYAEPTGKLITDTITIDEMDVMTDHRQDFDGWGHNDTTSLVIWIKNIDVDSLPSRLYMKSRYLPKPVSEENKDKMIPIRSRIFIQNTSWHHDSVTVAIYDSFRCVDCPVHSVKGSKLQTYFDIVNEEPATLDYTLQIKPSDPKMAELVKNDKE